MFLKLFILLCMNISLYANIQLQRTYYIESNDINISTVIPHAKKDVKLFEISHNYIEKIRTNNLIDSLQKNGYKIDDVPYRFISFIKKSPINLNGMKRYLHDYYTQKYASIDISNIVIMPRGYVEKLPKDYNIKMRSTNYLKNKNTFNIKTLDNKKIFFDYIIDAKLPVLRAKQDIKKGTELSILNTQIQIIPFERFKKLPLQEINSGIFQSKFNIQQNMVITLRDVEPVSLVRRGDYVNVTLNNSNLAITFMAKALQDGKLNDIITVQQNNGKKTQVIVKAKGKVIVK